MTRRSARTREALVEVHNRLVLERGKRQIKVGDIVNEAGVGRSTFYDHYASVDDIHLQALARPLAMLADAAVGRGEPERLANLLRHFWDNRARARETIAGRKGERVDRLLAELVAERLDAAACRVPAPLAAAQLAATAFAPVKAWLKAAAPCDAAALACSICDAGAATAQALRAS
jgi:AcrR family transcriptional regulator